MSIVNRLTKNFMFLNGIEIENQAKEEIIKYIEISEKMENIESCITNIYKALELIINCFIIENKLDIKISQSLSQKITEISNNSYVNASQYVYSLMREINSARNYEQHKHNDENKLQYENNEHDIIYKLKNFFVISKHLFNIKEPISFDYDAYKDKINSKKISAISDEQREKDNEIFKNLNDVLTINQDKIKSWLTIPDSRLVIPIYQRKYEWKIENINSLLEDIQSRANDQSQHYFGTIAQKKIINNNGELNQIKIIDGQQRITTSFLIICAARDVLINKYKIEINNIDWYKQITDVHDGKLENYIYNPGGTNENNDIFRQILNMQKITKIPNNKFYINYSTIYNFFENDLKSKNEITFFIETFLNQFNVASINFDNSKYPNKKEMELFENLNTKGLELNVVDLIKNHIFNFCNNDLLNNFEKDIAIKYNSIIKSSKIEENEGELESFYSSLSELITGKELSKNNRARFKEIQNSINEFLNQFVNLNKINDFNNMMDYLEIYMKIYIEIINKKQEQKFLKFLKIDKIINIILDSKKRRLFTFFAFLIYNLISKIYNWKIDYLQEKQDIKLKNNEIESIQKLFLEICKFIIRVKVITIQGDSDLKRILIKIASKYWNNTYSNIHSLCLDIINDIKQKANEEYSFEDFKKNLTNNNKSSSIRELFILMEHYMNNSLVNDGETIIRTTYQIEHILPIKIEKWLEDIPDEDKDEFIEKSNIYKEKIGNFLLLSGTDNKHAKNYKFEVKKEKVYKNLVSPLYINNDNDDIDVSKKDKWTFEDIDARTSALIEYITKNIITK